MILLVLGYLGASAFLFFSGNLHPLLQSWSQLTLGIFYGVVTPVIVFALRSFYRGNVSLKQVIGGCGALIAFAFALLITLKLVEDEPQMFWVGFEAAGFFVALFTTWVCFFSRLASRFLTLQQDKPH